MMNPSPPPASATGNGCEGAHEPSEAARARREAIIHAARDIFFDKGYAGTTMNSVAAAIGGSKTTLWSYFPSKEELFTAVLDDLVEQYSEALKIDLPEDGEVEVELRRFALAMIRTLSNEYVIALQRLVIGEAKRFPHLSEAFLNRAPKQGRNILTTYFAAAMARGKMRRGDTQMAANHFKALASANIPHSLLFNWPVDSSPAAMEADADAAVQAFLRIWKPD